MADPLSIAGSIAGLVGISDAVFRRVHHYYRAVKGANKEIEVLAEGVRSLSGVLHNLSLLAWALEDEPYDTSLRMHHINSCRQTLSKLSDKLIHIQDGIQHSSSLVRLRRQLVWPFSARETEELIRQISSQTKTITTALSADTMNLLLRSLSRQDELLTRVNKIEESVKKYSQIHTQIHIDQGRQRVLDFFLKVDPQISLDKSVKSRHSLTGLWLTESVAFSRWLHEPRSALWLEGIPGAGKTVLAGAMIEDSLRSSSCNRAVAFFFCQFADERSHDPVNLLATIASQIARQSPNAYILLEQYYEELHPQAGLARTPDSSRLSQLVQDMLGVFDKAMLLIDGVDECESNVVAITEALLGLWQNTENTSIAILSRPEHVIRELLEAEFTCLNVAAQKDDILLYSSAEIDARIRSKRLRIKHPQIKDEILSTLVNEANGMFRWVACQIDFMCELPTDAARRNALKSLPPTLFETYERMLHRVNQKNPAFQQMVQNSLQLIAFTDPPLTIREICEAISISDDTKSLSPEDIIDEEEILITCGSFIRKSGSDDRFEFAHFTVKEFLQSQKLLNNLPLQKFAVSSMKATHLLTICGLRFVQLENFNSAPYGSISPSWSILEHTQERISKQPFYEYASIFWPVHSEHHWDKPDVIRLALDLFAAPKSAFFINWALEIGRHCSLDSKTAPSHGTRCQLERNKDQAYNEDWTLNLARCILHDNFTPLHMASILGLPKLCSLLIDAGAQVGLESFFSTPLYCAVGGLGVFSMSRENRKNRRYDALFRSLSCLLRCETVALLMQRGASCVHAMPSQPGSSKRFLHDVGPMLAPLAILRCDLAEGLQILLELVRGGLVLDQLTLQDLKVIVNTPQLCMPSYCDILEEILLILKRESMHITQVSTLIDDIGAVLPLFSTSKNNNLDYAIDPSVMSNYDFFHFVLTAIQLDNQRDLQILAVDKNRDRILQLDADNNLLQCAVILGSLKATETLLQLGLGTILRDNGSMNPVLICHEDNRIATLRLLLKNGASLSARDEFGRTIWHAAADSNSVTILKEVAIHCPDHSQVLVQRDFDGMTPLSIAVENAHLEASKFLLKLFKQAGMCDNSPYLFINALRMNSVTVIRDFFTLGMKPQEEPDSGSTVFHYLPPNISLECVQLIKSVYPDSCRRRKDGKVPLEIFVRASLDRGEINLNIIEELTTESYIWPDTTDGTMLWSFFCAEILLHYLVGDTISTMGKLLADIGQRFIDIGAMASFEATMKTSGFSYLVSSLEPCNDGVQRHWSRFWPLVAYALASTTNETLANEHLSLAHALEFSVLFDTPELTSKLLDRGASTHLKNTVLSPITCACKLAPCGIGHFRLLLKYTTSEQLDDAGLIHLLCDPNIRDIKEKLLAIIEAGVDVNAIHGITGRPALHQHIAGGCQDTAIALIKAGADPNAPEDGWTSISKAVYGGCIQFLSQVEENSVHSVRWDTHCSVDVPFLKQRISSCNALHLAAITGNAECIDILCSTVLSREINAQSQGGFTPLSFAVLCEANEAIKTLCRYGADPNIRLDSGMHLLHSAVRGGSLETVSTLTQYGAKEGLDSTFKTPSQLAVLLGHKEIAWKLASAASQKPLPCFDTLNELSAELERAISIGDLQSCTELHSRGASLDLPIPICGTCTPLVLALYHRSIAIVNWLLEENVSCGGSACALHTMPHLSSSNIVELAAKDSSWDFILDHLLSRTLEDGLRCNPGIIASSSFAAAIKNGNYSGAEIILHHFKKCRDTHNTEPRNDHLKEHRKNLHYFEFDKENLLHYGVSIGDHRMVNFLLDHGASLDVQGNYGRVPLHIAFQNGDLNTIMALLNRGSQTDIRDFKGRTPMMYALKARNLPIIQVLLQQEVNLLHPDWLGRNELHFLAEMGTAAFGIFPLLVKKGLNPLSADIDGFCPVHFLLLDDHGHIRTNLLSRIRRLYHPHSMNPRLHTIRSTKVMYLLDLPRVVHKPQFQNSFQVARKLRRQYRRSLLCEASFWGFVSVVEILLSCGVDVEFEGSPEGTALLAACANGSLGTVKCLVRHGAKLSYASTATNQYRSAVTAAAAHENVLNWIMVGRFYDQLQIASQPFWGTQTEKVKSKPVPTTYVLLKGRMKRSKRESSLEYCVRLDSIRRAIIAEKFNGNSPLSQGPVPRPVPRGWKGHSILR
ncbi:ankyrin repeat-containing domain protein [Xylaria scruposa]|nr:ankyrin repeat-containing domain protein [Xylaria scruposa]